jgi:hypothetical protein
MQQLNRSRPFARRCAPTTNNDNGKGKRIDFSSLWKTVGRHIFIVAFFTAEEEVFSPER